MKRVATSHLYSASLTREQFLFHEMRTVSRLLFHGLNELEIKQKIREENLFQYPTERSIQGMINTCLKRIKLLDSEVLIQCLACCSIEESKQVCFYALIKASRLVRDFMVTVIGEKYRVLDMHWDPMYVNAFLLRLQEQHPDISQWSATTLTRIRQILMRLLVDNGYLENQTCNKLNPVWLYPSLKQAILSNHDEILLPAFNCFSKEN